MSQQTKLHTGFAGRIEMCMLSYYAPKLNVILGINEVKFSFIVFGMSLTLGVIDELQRPGEDGAYNARAVLGVMVQGLEEELDLRLSGKMKMPSYRGPSIDADGYNRDLDVSRGDNKAKD